MLCDLHVFMYVTVMGKAIKEHLVKGKLVVPGDLRELPEFSSGSHCLRAITITSNQQAAQFADAAVKEYERLRAVELRSLLLPNYELASITIARTWVWSLEEHAPAE